MKLKLSVAAACLAVAMLGAGAASAQNIYLKSADLPGTSKAASRGEWIELQAFSEGVSNTAATSGAGSARGGAGAGKAVFKDITFVKPVDAASIKLREFAITGKRLPLVEVELASGPSAAPLYKVTLKDVAVTSVATEMSAGGGPPSESVTLTFSQASWALSGTPAFGWDITRNVTVKP